MHTKQEIFASVEELWKNVAVDGRIHDLFTQLKTMQTQKTMSSPLQWKKKSAILITLIGRIFIYFNQAENKKYVNSITKYSVNIYQECEKAQMESSSFQDSNLRNCT